MRLEREEEARRQAEKDAEEMRKKAEQLSLEQERQAARLQAEKEAEENRRKEEKLKLLEQKEAQEQAKRRAEEAANRQAEEEKERAEQAAFEEQVARDKAERQRRREEARRQAEEEARLQEEAEIAARQRAEEEEEERLRLQAEEEEKAEREKLKQEAQEEAARAREQALAAQKEEDERLAKVRAKAEAERKKRNAFLDDMDTFSSSFEKTQSEKEAARLQAEKESESLFTGTIASASSSYVATTKDRSKYQQQASEEDAARAKAHEEKVRAYEKQAELEAEREAEQEAKNRQKQRALQEGTVVSSKAGANFNDLATSLFSQSEKEKESESVATKDDLFGNFRGDEEEKSSELEKDDELRMPNIDRRINTLRARKDKALDEKSMSATSKAPGSVLQDLKDDSNRDNQSSTVPKVHRPINNDVLGKFSDDEDDDCDDEEISKAQRLEWKAKQEDLTNIRKDFHGAVTYAFGGCFSWQMYSAVDAVDEHGKSYTEYLMRLQWGTNWDNLQPWLVARRYREFDTLNELLLQNYPNVKSKMTPLPKKQFFGSLDPATVEQRTKDIEGYISNIVTNIPSIMKSKYIDGFFNIQERISQIRKQIEEQKKKSDAEGKKSDQQGSANIYDGVVPLAPGTIEELGSSQKPESNKMAKERPKLPPLQVNDLLSLEDVEAKTPSDMKGFDDDELGRAEERIRDFRYRLTKTPTKYLTKDAKIRQLLDDCQAMWPRLHASCRIGDDAMDSMIIARAMQAEEDLDGAIKELRSFLMAQSIGSPLHC